MLRITPEERAALQLLADGQGSGQIAGRLGIGLDELDRYLAGLFGRMGASGPGEAVAQALRRGLLAVTGTPDLKAGAQEG